MKSEFCTIPHPIYDVPTSDAIAMQTVGRVRRLGQQRIVKVYEYIVSNTFDIRRLSNNANKVILTPVTELNRELINMSFNEKTEMVDLGYRVENDDDTLRQATVEEKEMLGPKMFVFVRSNDVKYQLVRAVKERDGDILAGKRAEVPEDSTEVLAETRVGAVDPTTQKSATIYINAHLSEGTKNQRCVSTELKIEDPLAISVADEWQPSESMLKHWFLF